MRIISLMLLSLLLTGCGTGSRIAGSGPIEFVPDQGSFRQGDLFGKHYGEVLVYEKLPKDHPFRRIGLITARGSFLRTDKSLQNKIKQKAAEFGGNAIILIPDLKASRRYGVSKNTAAIVIRVDKSTFRPEQYSK